MFTCISSKFLVYYVARTCRTTYTKAAKTRAIDREPAPHTEHAQYLKWALTKLKKAARTNHTLPREYSNANEIHCTTIRTYVRTQTRHQLTR